MTSADFRRPATSTFPTPTFPGNQTNSEEISAATFPIPNSTNSVSTPTRSLNPENNSDLPAPSISTAAFPVPTLLTARPANAAKVRSAPPVVARSTSLPAVAASISAGSGSPLPGLPTVTISNPVVARYTAAIANPKISPIKAETAMTIASSRRSVLVSRAQPVQPGSDLHLPTRDNPIQIAVPAPEIRSVIAVTPVRRSDPAPVRVVRATPPSPLVSVSLLPVPLCDNMNETPDRFQITV